MSVNEIILVGEHFYVSFGYLIVFLGTFIETSPLGFTIPGGLLVALGAFYAQTGQISLYGILFFSFLGMLLTFVLAYILGHKTGKALIKKLHQEKNAERAKNLLTKNGPVILTTSLLANMTRFWVAYVAGIQRYPFFKFLFYASAASLTWSSLLVVVGALAGQQRASLETGLARVGILAWGLLIVALFVIYKKSKEEYTTFKEDEVEK